MKTIKIKLMIIVFAISIAAVSCDHPTGDHMQVQDIQKEEAANSLDAITHFLRSENRGRDCTETAVDLFLKIDGIDGETKDADHEGEIDVLSISWSTSVRANSSLSGRGTGKAKIDFQDMDITKWADNASPELRRYASTGEPILETVLTLRSTCGEEVDYLIITMKNVVISSYQTGNYQGHMSEKIKLSGNLKDGWDLKINKKV